MPGVEMFTVTTRTRPKGAQRVVVDCSHLCKQRPNPRVLFPRRQPLIVLAATFNVLIMGHRNFCREFVHTNMYNGTHGQAFRS